MGQSVKDKLLSFFGSENIEFLKHSRNYLSASIISNVLTAAAVPLFSRVLTTAEYGVISIFVAVVSMLTILSSLNINSGIVRYFLDAPPDFGRCLGSSLAFLFGFNVLFMGGIFLFREPLAAFCEMDTELFLFAMGASFFAGIVEIFLALTNAAKQSRKYSIITVLKTSTNLALFLVLIFVLSDRRYMGKVYADLAVMVVLGGYALFSLNRLAEYTVEKKHIRYVLLFSLPLVPHAMSRFILGYFDRIIIRQLTTAEATGIYSFAYDVGTVMNMVVLASVRAWRPIFFEEYREGQLAKLERMSREYADYLYLAAIGISLFAVDAVMLLADKSYHVAIPLVPIIVLGYVFVFLYTLFFQYASYRKRTELISLSTFIAGFANIGLNYAFIPLYGYEAAAYTTLASFFLLFLLHYLNARFILKEKVLSLKNLAPNLLVTIAIISLYMVLDRIVASYLLMLPVRLALLAAGAYLLVFKKKRRAKAKGHGE
jgi:O-antigen/teichoic acid export membrane protein